MPECLCINSDMVSDATLYDFWIKVYFLHRKSHAAFSATFYINTKRYIAFHLLSVKIQTGKRSLIYNDKDSNIRAKCDSANFACLVCYIFKQVHKMGLRYVWVPLKSIIEGKNKLEICYQSCSCSSHHHFNIFFFVCILLQMK